MLWSLEIAGLERPRFDYSSSCHRELSFREAESRVRHDGECGGEHLALGGPIKGVHRARIAFPVANVWIRPAAFSAVCQNHALDLEGSLRRRTGDSRLISSLVSIRRG